MKEDIKKYVARYVVPFYFPSENNGYSQMLTFFRHYPNPNHKAALPIDGTWVEKGFWKKDAEHTTVEMETDIYQYLFKGFEEHQEACARNGTNLGVSFIYQSKHHFIEIKYCVNGNPVLLYGLNMGVLICRNGVSFIWYEIGFPDAIDQENYIQFQHQFKELTSLGELIMKSDVTTKNQIVESPLFCMGEWLKHVVDPFEFPIHFWSEREVFLETSGQKEMIPAKALLFQYFFVETEERQERCKLAFQLANGYDTKYEPPLTLLEECYEPFGNTCFHISKSGFAYVVSRTTLSEGFFKNNFPYKFVKDYFFIYLLLLYQTFSCAQYSRLLTKLPADTSAFEHEVAHLDTLESLDTQINLFLIKSIFDSISSVHHQNGCYKYGKMALCIDDDIHSLKVGLDALRGIEREKYENQCALIEKMELKIRERRESAVNCAVTVVGFLVVISTIMDVLNLVDWFLVSKYRIHSWHIMALGIVAVITLLIFVCYYKFIRKTK